MRTREPTWLNLLILAMFTVCGIGMFAAEPSDAPNQLQTNLPSNQLQANLPENQLQTNLPSTQANLFPLNPHKANSPKSPATISSPINEQIIKIRYGDTFSKVLTQNGLAEVGGILMALKKVYDPSKIRAGREIAITKQQDKLIRLDFSPRAGYRIGVRRDGDGKLQAWAKKAKEVSHVRRVEAELNTNLMDTALALGVPMGVLAEVVTAFSYDVDFQRDILKGNRFDFLFEVVRDKDSDEFIRSRLLRASLDYRRSTSLIYRYGDGRVPFYYENGASVIKSLLRTPVEATRVSSRYGKRKDPIMGYTRMHRGVDFAAPTGTPVYAAGEGVVERANRYGNYGKYVRINHNKTYKTAYAHLHKIAKGIKKGTRVRQGQVIGYVGSTGRSTGPHLHFEVHKHNAKVDPLRLALPSGKKLTGDELKQFKADKSKIENQYAAALQLPTPNITIATTATIDQGGE